MDEFLACKICSETFSEFRSPLILECGHTFCSPCLALIFYENRQIICPEDKKCDKRHFSSLKKNILLMQLIDYKIQTTRNLCSNHKNKKTRFLCIDCNIEFCSKCLVFHNSHSWLDIKNASEMKKIFFSLFEEIKSKNEEILTITKSFQKLGQSVEFAENELISRIKEKFLHKRREIDILENQNIENVRGGCLCFKEKIKEKIEFFEEFLKNKEKVMERFENKGSGGMAEGILWMKRAVAEFLNAKNSFYDNFELEKLMESLKILYMNI